MRRLLGWIDSSRHSAMIMWGFVDQGFSSATNFGLSLLAGRVLGPAGLGKVFIGFSAYLIVLGLQRRLIIEPLITASPDAVDSTRLSGSFGLSMALLGGSFAMLGVVVAGLVLPGFAGDGLLLVSPWLITGMTQDFCRHMLFREKRGTAAACNDGAWLMTMAATAPVAWALGTDWAVMACWGLGTLAGTILGFIQTKIKPASLPSAWQWWRREAWAFGSWNASAGIVGNIGTHAGTLILSGILGARALGGLRAAQTVFAPLTLITPAISLPGLPAVTRAYSSDRRLGKRLALRLSGVAMGAAACFIIILILGGWRLLPALFGEAFRPFRDLIWPIAAAQLFIASSVGLLLLIKAQRRGRVLLVNRGAAALISLSVVVALALSYGLIGAAWGSAVGSFASFLVLLRASMKDLPQRSTTSGSTALSRAGAQE
jgi:O-antigen/teichoic acid export membrane protein